MIVDVFAGVALVVGAALVALGGLGLVRFPDVFTRMHAATKSATVGVIGTTAAAALEAGAPQGVSILLLVVALLFLSGPLGMSLLARAAFRDPETPRVATTRELETKLPRTESTSALRVGGTGWALGAWLFVVWLAVFGSLRANVLVSGVIAAAVVAVALRRLAPRWPRSLLRPGAFLEFVVYFVGQLAAATWDVASTLLRPVEDLRPAVVEIPLVVATRNEVALLMTAISFTPGTVALEVHDDMLYVHVLSRQSVEDVVAGIMEMQRRVALTFGRAPRSGIGNHVTEDI